MDRSSSELHLRHVTWRKIRIFLARVWPRHHIYEYTIVCTQLPASQQLLEAASAGDVALVNKLLAAGTDVNTVNESGNKPVHLAAYEGHVPVLEALLAAGQAT